MTENRNPRKSYFLVLFDLPYIIMQLSLQFHGPELFNFLLSCQGSFITITIIIATDMKFMSHDSETLFDHVKGVYMSKVQRSQFDTLDRTQ